MTGEGFRRRAIAVGYGTAAHGLFAVGVGLMVAQLFGGLQHGPWHARSALAGVARNTVLVVQFPFLHSFLLGERGRVWLRRLAPRRYAADLATTTFAALASIQLVLVFGLWSPSGIVWWRPQGTAWWVLTVAYAGSWAFLLVALRDAGLALQTGSIGWTAVFRGRRPRFAGFPTHGLFRHVRQPVYVGFALTLWTGPVWTPDRLALALGWTAYCVLGPRLKERRYLRRHGEAYAAYRERVPYLVPVPRRGRA